MIKYGIIGRNFVVDMMLAAMAAVPDAAKPVAIYSRNMADAAEFMKSHELQYACDDLASLANYPEINAVYIASPNACHYEQAKLMLESGKHVLCEKPAASNADQVRKLVHLAEEKNLIFLEAMRPVYGDILQIVQQNIPHIAPLRQVQIYYGKPSSRLKRFLSGENVNTFNPALSNAAIMDLGCYGIHSLVHLFGKPESVSAQSVHLDNGFEAYGTVLMRYPEFVAEVSYSKVNLLDIPCFLNGDKGMICFDTVNDTKRILLQMYGELAVDLNYSPYQPNDMVCELKAFDRFVMNGIRPVKENQNSIITSEIIDEARRQTNTLFPSDGKSI